MTARAASSPITIVGDPTARWAKQLHAASQCLSLREHAERSPRHLRSAGYTIFTKLLQDKSLRPTAALGLRRHSGMLGLGSRPAQRV